jgi:ceramide glucosyltransferase
MVSQVLVVWVVFGVLLVATMAASQRRLLVARRSDDGATPPVTILKPLKGVDPDLESNLRSFYRLDYPDYQIVFGVSERSDPGLEVARRVAAEFPHVVTLFAVGGEDIGFNPKVNNLANMLPHARHELLLISDSNVTVPPDHLRVVIPELLRPGVGLVTCPIRGVGGRGFGAALERFQLNTFVMGGVAAATLAFRKVCAVGKSMALRRSDLERIGGLRELARYLAEDQVCGEAVSGLGLKTVVAPLPVDNVIGAIGLRGFVARHLRWARIRRRTAPHGYLAEALANPVPPALLHLALFPNIWSWALAAATVAVPAALGLAAERRLGVRRSPLVYPPLELVRALTVAVLWPVPLVSSSVEWRGNRFRIGRRTLLHPTGESSIELASDEAAA